LFKILYGDAFLIFTAISQLTVD